MWINDRWNEFRGGHNTYLAFIPAFVNFILLTYNYVLLAYQVPFLKENLVVYALLMVSIYIPFATLAGRFHNKKVLPNDGKIASGCNPYTKEMLERLERIEKILKQTN
jgi:hypothetical protein